MRCVAFASESVDSVAKLPECVLCSMTSDSKAAGETNPLSYMESLHNGQSKETEYCYVQLGDCVPPRMSSAVLAQVNVFFY